jgi:hypothetical protein
MVVKTRWRFRPVVLGWLVGAAVLGVGAAAATSVTVDPSLGTPLVSPPVFGSFGIGALVIGRSVRRHRPRRMRG